MIFQLFFLSLISGPVDSNQQQVPCPCPFDTTNGTRIAINVSFGVSEVDHFDDVAGILSIRGILLFKWIDPCAWPLMESLFPARTSQGISIIADSNLFWHPYILQDHSQEYLIQGQGMPVGVEKSGQIQDWIQKTWTTRCVGMSRVKFPFDRHHCSVEIFLWNNLLFNYFDQASFDLSIYHVNSNELFDFNFGNAISTNRSYCQSGGIDCLASNIQFPIEISRKWYPYYFYGLFVPQVALAVLQISAFLIPYDHCERSAFSVTLFVAYTVTKSEIQTYIPQSSESITIVTASSVAMIGSMLATVYFGAIYAVSTGNSEKRLCLFIDRLFLLCFTIFFTLLYFSTIVSIAY